MINNLETRRLFENRLCGGDHLQIDLLRWPEAANRYAIGAQVRLETSTGTYLRTVRAVGAYLPAYIGVPDVAAARGAHRAGRKVVCAQYSPPPAARGAHVWPDGKWSVLQASST